MPVMPEAPDTPVNESILKSLAGFDSVWRRVTGEDTLFSEEETLKGFIRDELGAAAFYTSLARMFQGTGRTLLLSHAGDAKRHVRRLRAEYFIRTGLSYAPSDGGRGVGGKLASLRQALERENSLALAYEKAAAQTASPELREVYEAFSADAKAHAQSNRALLIDSF